jgi:excinuclease ABC subunit C
VGARLFDQKFGVERLRELPREPGVYLFRDAEGRVLYVGKAKDLRRRLAGYRNASRRKAHRKMRALVREAASLEVRPSACEKQALLLENELIRTLRPPFNVDGAFAFLYPALGIGHADGRVLLAFTSRPEEWSSLALRWHGCFRSRARTRAAFDALVALFGSIGHREPMSRLPAVPLRRGVRLEAFRRLPPELAAALRTPARKRERATRRRGDRATAAHARRLRAQGRRRAAPRAAEDGALRLGARRGTRRPLHRSTPRLRLAPPPVHAW